MKNNYLNLIFAIILTTFSQQSFAHQHDSQNNLPQLSQNEGLIDTQQSLMIGEWALRQLNATAPLMQDYWLQESMEQIVWQMNAVARTEAPLALVLINDRQINAFAIPSGLIGLNVGLIDKAKTLDEVASVIAHEIAHVSQRHYQHRNDEKTKQLLTQIGGILAGVAMASAGGSEAMLATMAGASSISANQTASFSRSQEREADRVGMQIMAQAGYDVHAMPAFFNTLDQQNSIKSNAFIPSFVLSHPLTAERLSEAKDRANNYPKNQIIKNDHNSLYRKQQFEQIQWRSRYLAKITNKQELIQNAKHNNGAKLALAWLLIDERNFVEAGKVLQSFAKEIEHYQNPLAVITSANLLEKQGNYDKAIETLQNLVNLLPERKDLKLYLADIYLNNPKNTVYHAKQVIALLQPLSKQFDKNIFIWQKLQQASEILVKNTDNNEKKVHQINVLRYRANAEFWKNQPENAMTSLSQAKNIAQTLNPNTAILAVIDKQIEQLKVANQFKPS